MPSDPTGIAPAGGVTVPPSDDGNGTQPIAPQNPTGTGRQENGLAELLQSFRTELVDMRREFRNRLRPEASGTTPTQPAERGTPAAAPNSMDPMAYYAFRDAVDESGVIVTVAQRKMLERLYRAESGVADPVSWIREQVEVAGWRTPTQVAPAAAPVPAVAPAAPAKPPLTPAPTGTGAGTHSLPDDPALLTESQIAAMSPTEALAYWNRYKARSGTFRHPWAEARDAQRLQGQELSAASAAIRAVIAGKK